MRTGLNIKKWDCIDYFLSVPWHNHNHTRVARASRREQPLPAFSPPGVFALGVCTGPCVESAPQLMNARGGEHVYEDSLITLHISDSSDHKAAPDRAS